MKSICFDFSNSLLCMFTAPNMNNLSNAEIKHKLFCRWQNDNDFYYRFLLLQYIRLLAKTACVVEWVMTANTWYKKAMHVKKKQRIWLQCTLKIA